MIVYNVTVKIDWPYAAEYVHWMKTEHIPEMIATGCFEDARMMRLLEVDDEEGPTFVCQFEAATLAKYEAYINDHSAVLRGKSLEAWGEKLIAFRTVMEKID